MLKRNGNNNSRLIMLGLAGAVGLGVFGYLQLTTTTVYVAKQPIMSGTQITEELLSSGALVAESVPRSLTNESTIKEFSDISGNFTKFPIGPGQILYSYDVANESDVKNNPILREQNLEAQTLKIDEVLGASNGLNIGDRVNIYGVEEVDLGVFSTEEDGTIEIGKLPEHLQENFMQGFSLKKDDEVKIGKYKVTKLIGQNVPVVEVLKDYETKTSTEFTIGVTNKIASNILLTQKDGKVAVNVLPYSETEYKVKDDSVSVQSINYMGKSDVIKD